MVQAGRQANLPLQHTLQSKASFLPWATPTHMSRAPLPVAAGFARPTRQSLCNLCPAFDSILLHGCNQVLIFLLDHCIVAGGWCISAGRALRWDPDGQEIGKDSAPCIQTPNHPNDQLAHIPCSVNGISRCDAVCQAGRGRFLHRRRQAGNSCSLPLPPPPHAAVKQHTSSVHARRCIVEDMVHGRDDAKPLSGEMALAVGFPVRAQPGVAQEARTAVP
jgi:hypothetical protein